MKVSRSVRDRVLSTVSSTVDLYITDSYWWKSVPFFSTCKNEERLASPLYYNFYPCRRVGSCGRGSNRVGFRLVRWLVRLQALPGGQGGAAMTEEQKTCTFFKKSGRKGLSAGRKRRKQQTPSDDDGSGETGGGVGGGVRMMR